MSVKQISSLRSQIAKLATRLQNPSGAMTPEDREALRERRLRLAEALWAAEIEASGYGWRLQPAYVRRKQR